MLKKGWNIAIDRGGTFTDLVAVDPEGFIHTEKLLSDSPLYNDPSIEAIRRLLNLKNQEQLPVNIITGLRFGSTVTTNALLERKGGKVLLLVTKGFADLLEIGHQARDDIFALGIKKTKQLYHKVIEIEERIDSNGTIIKDINLNKLGKDLKNKKSDIDSVVILFLNSWVNNNHETACYDYLKSIGISNIFSSSKVSKLIKVISRGQAAVVDAYLDKVIKSYLKGIKKETGNINIEFMQSSGGVCSAESFSGKNGLLSGPAGGVIAVGKIADETGIEGAIGFDMGGTSTDVSRYDGSFEMSYEQKIAGVEFQTEMLNLETVAAGGGSILWFDGMKMRVGPESAGGYPGPACYGFGGPLAITDANLITGRISADNLPKIFGKNRNSTLDLNASIKKFKETALEIQHKQGWLIDIKELAIGFLKIANEKMAMAIKEISVSKGFDVRNYALVCFGGAGGQHACQVADLLGIKQIIFHPLGGLLSAFGIGLTKPEKKISKTILLPFTRKNQDKIKLSFNNLYDQLIIEDKELSFKRKVDLRQVGSDSPITIPYTTYEETLCRLEEKFTKIFGFTPDTQNLEVVTLRMERAEKSNFFDNYRFAEIKKSKSSNKNIDIYYENKTMQAKVYHRESLSLKNRESLLVNGPAYIIDPYSTLVVDPGWQLSVKDNAIISIKRTSDKNKQNYGDLKSADPVLLEVFNNIFANVASEMGYTLQNCSHSVNIKERLDFSCAIFDTNGEMVANAPHIPVHLGSMSDAVKGILTDFKDNMQPGDIYLTNNPYKGGSHLPDLTVICPVFHQGKPSFYIAARGHHADIGGKTPGSLPPVTSHIEEEGVLIDKFLLVRGGVLRQAEIEEILLNHPYPVRNISERISDLKAQIASCNKGITEIKRVIDRFGRNVVDAYMIFIRKNASYAIKNTLFNFLDKTGNFKSSFKQSLDDGTKLHVNIQITGSSLDNVRCVIDFTGCGPSHLNDSLNTPISVTRSAVLYVLRVLAGVEIPLNGGCLDPIDIIIPKNSILSPVYPLPIGSGNVETSQRIVDLLLGGFNVAAASQGTMNNLLFQVESDTPYYETIAGGEGAVANSDGASGVQVHMTNTRMTDPEIVEQRHPDVRVESFSIRKFSGGDGKHKGGNGVIRELKFLEKGIVSIISERRASRPYGLNGGKAGKSGENWLVKANEQTSTKLPHRVTIEVEAGDSIIIKTPGGGGFGER